MFILYRAVCYEEYIKTLQEQTLQFSRNREKCFSPDIDWIKTVVQNNKFNNSNFCKDRYKYLLTYIFSNTELHKFRQCRNEWKTNIRSYPKPIKVYEILHNY